MRTPGSPTALAHRRQLAVQRAHEGYSTQEIADFLGVDPSSVRRWLIAFHRRGLPGLTARPVAGRPAKLTPTQEKVVLRWLADSPTAHGFATELWSGPRIAQLIQQEFGVQFHPKYLPAWLRARDFTPQKPLRVPRERDPAVIAAWLADGWPRVKKRPPGRRPTLS